MDTEVRSDERPLGVEAAVVAYWHDNNWKQQHANLVELHKKKNAIEAELLDRVFDFEDAGLYRRLGYPSMKQYLMSEFGYSAHTANECDRVARELFDLPQLSDTFHEGELCWSKIRELTRVLTPETERIWLDAIEGKTATEVQRMVSGQKKGALPGDRPNPALMTQWVGAEVSAEVAAMWKQLRVELERQHGRALTNAEFVELLVQRGGSNEKVVTPPVQLAVSTCRTCKKGFQVGAGVELEMTDAKLAAACCDSVDIGDLENDALGKFEAAIPAPTRRKVYQRDGYACRVPGCTSTRFLHIHHVVFREHGGTNALSNLILLCGGHHALVHDRMLTITGAAPDQLRFQLPTDDE